MSNVKKMLALLVVAMMVLLTACGEKPVDTNATTTGGDVVVTTTTAGDDVTTTVGDDVTTTVGDDVTTTVGDDVTTTVGDDVTTTVQQQGAATQQQQQAATTTQQQQQAATTTQQQQQVTTAQRPQQQSQVTTTVKTTTVQGVVVTTTRRTQRTQSGNSGGSSSDDFRGKTLIIMSRDNFTGSSDIQKAYKSGIDTWATRYGSKVEFRVCDYGYADLQAAIAGGESPDLFYQVERFPEICAVGLVQPVDEYLPEGQQVLVGKSIEYGSWRGHLWGMGIGGGGGRMCIYFDRELFKSYPTVKTPRQYFEEGNWTWDTFRTCAKDILKATNGAYGVKFDQFATAGGHNIINVTDDGRVTSTLATDTHNQDLLKWVYNLKTQDKIFDAEKVAIGKFQGDAEPKYGTNGETKTIYGEVWYEIVPFPANPKTGEYTSCEQIFSFVVPVGAQNPAMSVDLALSILAPWKQAVDGYNYCAYERKVRDAMKGASALLKYPDVLTYLPYNEKDATYGSLYTMGTAQAINSLKDVHAADCKTYNDTYIK